MIKNKIPIVALIPARKGSKSIPKKNTFKIYGKPLINFTIEAALKSKYIDKIYISTNDNEVIKIAEKFNINYILRPSKFSKDSSSPNVVMKHFITKIPNFIKEKNPYIIYLQPTSPLRDYKHINATIDMIKNNDSKRVLSVVELKKNPHKAFKLNEKKNELFSIFDQKFSNKRRQDLPKCYFPNGSIYLFRMNDFLKVGGFPSNGSSPYIMSEKDSLDIDDYEDIKKLKFYLK